MKTKTKALALSCLFSWSVASCPLHLGFDAVEQGSLPEAELLKFSSIFHVKHGDIEQPSDLVPSATFQRVSWWLTLFSEQLALSGLESALILVADIPLWSELDVEHPRSVSIDIAVPEQPKNVILVTQASLQAIVTKQIEMEHAMEIGLVRFHQANEHLRERVVLLRFN
ncbi:hypothetical protein [Vibrio sp. SCSIO 43136]|uniref:hypothetical protein n=1 Tax=Vibrio sp. SCSIO 43136 TaxID=2819101 RepID=UPI0020765B45|nr:hypothetical protein [Vibrio sp. SCSIO 43136]USD68024.1 hypothetical protein J4N39_17765 [Vibrio sp. SCSIO 43136]